MINATEHYRRMKKTVRFDSQKARESRNLSKEILRSILKAEKIGMVREKTSYKMGEALHRPRAGSI